MHTNTRIREEETACFGVKTLSDSREKPKQDKYEFIEEISNYIYKQIFTIE